MPFLLRSGFALTLASGVVGNTWAQSSRTVADSSTVASTASATHLLHPTQLKAGKYSTYLIQRYATDQKARAIIRLFARKQRGGSVWLATGAISTAIIAWQANTSIDDKGTTTLTVSPLGYGLFLGVFGGVGISKLARFNNTKLYQALSAHEQGTPLPASITKKLRKTDYR